MMLSFFFVFEAIDVVRHRYSIYGRSVGRKRLHTSLLHMDIVTAYLDGVTS